MKNRKSPDHRDAFVGSRIRSQRLVRRMSQTELGRRVGVTFQQVQKYEKGRNRVSASRLQRISDVLAVPVAFFFGEGAESKNASAAAETGLAFLETAGAVRLVRAYAKKLGAPDLIPREFRHSAVLCWFKAGITPEEIQKRLGLKTTYAFRTFAPLFKSNSKTT